MLPYKRNLDDRPVFDGWTGPPWFDGGMTRYAVLLRGINVGRRKVAMADLREVAEAAGFKDVRTHLNSGNLIIGSDHDAEKVRKLLEPAIAERFGFEVPVVVRTVDQLRAVLDANPFPDADPSRLIINFCATTPPADVLDRMARLATDAEPVAVVGEEVVVDFRDGIGRSKLAGAGDKVIGVTATGRNLRTVQKLVELLS